MVQMFLIAYNNDDWNSLFGDPTKFGLGLFSVVFDIFFMLQHYVFYRGNTPHERLQVILALTSFVELNCNIPDLSRLVSPIAFNTTPNWLVSNQFKYS